jgi:tetratricopeptide (TPR) repeat protein
MAICGAAAAAPRAYLPLVHHAPDAVNVRLSVPVIDLGDVVEWFAGNGGDLTVSTAPDADDIVRRVQVRPREAGVNWAVFALANASDEKIERLIVVPHSRMAGSRVVTMTPSSGDSPDRKDSATADVFRVTLDPNAIITFVVQLRADRLPQFYLWEADAYRASHELTLRPMPTVDDIQTCDYESGDVAIAACTRAIASGRYIGQNLAALYMYRCSHYNDKGDYDHAIPDCNEAIRLDPKELGAYNNRCLAYKNKGDYDRAIPDCNEAIRLDPKWGNAYNNRGDAYYAKKDYDTAIADYTYAIRLDPMYALAYRNRGRVYEAKKDYDRAIADVSAANRLDAYDYSSRCWDRALAGRDLQDALADCNESLRLQPNDAITLGDRGLVQLRLGAFEQAIADYSVAIAQNAKDADALYGRGIAKLKKGDAAGGNADIAAAKALEPDIANVYAGYGAKAD